MRRQNNRRMSFQELEAWERHYRAKANPKTMEGRWAVSLAESYGKQLHERRKEHARSILNAWRQGQT